MSEARDRHRVTTKLIKEISPILELEEELQREDLKFQRWVGEVWKR